VTICRSLRGRWTANFVKGIPLYSISLALINDKEPVLGGYIRGHEPGLRRFGVSVDNRGCKDAAGPPGNGQFLGNPSAEIRGVGKVRADLHRYSRPPGDWPR
jgi:hypothetical protein